MSDNVKEQKKIVEPSILSGFLELLPAEQVAFNKMKDTIENTFKLFGFIPIDTPVIEKSEVLLAKSGGDTAKQVYRFTKGDSDLSLRFDLTVPLARYVAQHYADLIFPFRRYHIGKVYRGERPQKGRFREFYQCDIDIVGNGKLSINNDAEIVSVIYSTFKALGFGDFTVMINNRKLLNGFFVSLNINQPTEVMRIVDKIDKIGVSGVTKELNELGLNEETINSIIKLTECTGSSVEIIESLKSWDIKNDLFLEGLSELEEVCKHIRSYNVPDENFRINPKIARGLDYYTGTVYETFLNDYLDLGSVCSGGRYDELASNYTKQSLPGVGISIGLSRLYYQLKEAGIVKTQGATPTQILLIPMDNTIDYTLNLANKFRNAGIFTEVYLNENKMAKKFSYADKLGIAYAAVIGEDEIINDIIKLKDMKTGIQHELSAVDCISFLSQKEMAWFMLKASATDLSGMLAPDIRIASDISIGKQHRVVKYDVRFKKPYRDEIIYPSAMHSIVHMITYALKEVSEVKVVDFSPMGSRTGFFLTVVDPSDTFITNDFKGALIVALDLEEVPEANKRQCGNASYHDIDEAKREILDFLECYYGIRLILKWYKNITWGELTWNTESCMTIL